MGISCVAAWLRVAILAAGCMCRMAIAQDSPPSPARVTVSIGNVWMNAEELRDFSGQSPAERRQRLDVILAAHPEAFGAHYLRVEADQDLQDYLAMIEDSRAVLADASIDRRLRARVLIMRAEALIQLRRLPEAIAAAGESVDIDDSDARALFARGWALYVLDNSQTEKALADLDRALQLDPDQGIGYFRRASVLQAQGKLDRAAEDFERALALTPDDAPTHAGYGALALEMKDFQRALAQYDAALRLTPRDPVVWASRAEVDLALDRIEDAGTDAARAIELGAAGDDLVNAHALWGLALERQMDFDGAAREYERAVAINAASPAATLVPRMQWFSGDFARALKSMREQLASTDSDPYAALGLFIVQVRVEPAGEAAAAAELAARAPAHRPRVWTDTLVDLMLNRTTLDAALAEADAAPTGQLRAGMRCEADYYTAERLLIRGQEMAATPLLEEAYWVCPSTYVEARAVVAERRLLAARSQSR